MKKIKDIQQALLLAYRQEPLTVRLQRGKIGVLVGLVIAFLCSFTASLVNPLTLPSLHLFINWTALIQAWVILSLGLSLVGFISGWFTENNGAVAGGGAIVACLVLLVVLAEYSKIQEKIPYLSVYWAVILPVLGASVFLAWEFRALINRINQLRREDDENKKRRGYGAIIGVIVALGLIPGLFYRFDLSTIKTLTRVSRGIQYAQNPDQESFIFPLEFRSAVEKRSTMKYTLYSRPSHVSVGFIDVTIYFDDGYVITCMVPTSMDLYDFANRCNEGEILDAN